MVTKHGVRETLQQKLVEELEKYYSFKLVKNPSQTNEENLVTLNDIQTFHHMIPKTGLYKTSREVNNTS